MSSEETGDQELAFAREGSKGGKSGEKEEQSVGQSLIKCSSNYTRSPLPPDPLILCAGQEEAEDGSSGLGPDGCEQSGKRKGQGN